MQASVKLVSNKFNIYYRKSERNCPTRRFSLVLNEILEEATANFFAAGFQTSHTRAPGSTYILELCSSELIHSEQW